MCTHFVLVLIVETPNMKAKQSKVNASLLGFNTWLVGGKCCAWKSFVTKPWLRNHYRIHVHHLDIGWGWPLKSIVNIHSFLYALPEHVNPVFLLHYLDPLLIQHHLLLFQTHILIQYLPQAHPTLQPLNN